MRNAIISMGITLSILCAGGLAAAHDTTAPRAADPSVTEGPRPLRDALRSLTAQLLDQRLGAEARTRVASARQARLAELMEHSPAAALRQALPAAVRAALPHAVAALIEREESHEGEIEVLHADGPAGDTYFYNLHTRSGERIALHFAADAPDVPTGARVRARGLRAAQAMALGSTSGLTVLAAPASSGTFGESRTIVLLLKFQDKPTASQVTPAQAQQMMFGSGASVSNFYREASYGQAWLSGDVVGPYVLPMNSTGCDTYSIASLAQTAARAAGVNLSAYSRYIYAFPTTGCTWWGLGSVGGNPSQAWINGSFQASVVSHEMGHNFGLYHSHSFECGSVAMGEACSLVEYGDTLDIMGSTYTPLHFNAVQKELLGWLNWGASPPITQATASGVFTIEPIETSGAAPKAVKVRSPLGDWYYVEYRRPVGFDASLSTNSNVMSGVVVHYYNNQRNGVYLLDMTPATSAWSDPALAVASTFSDASRAVSITPVWVDGTTAGVNITMTGTACVRALPTVTASSATQATTPGAAVSYVLTIKNNDTGCGSATISAQSTAPAGWLAAVTPPSVTVADGASTTATLTATLPGAVSSGSYALSTSLIHAGISVGLPVTAVVAPVATPGSFRDEFERPDAADLGNGWSAVGGRFAVVAGAAQNPAAGRAVSVQPSFSGATTIVSGRFVSADNNASPQLGLVMRYKSAGTYYACYRAAGGSSVLRLSRFSNGAETVLKQVAVPNPAKGAFFNLSCQASGSTLTLKLDTTTLTATDATIASGTAGLFVNSTKAAAHRADSFSASVQ